MKKVEKTKRMRQAKRDTLWKEIETEGKWQKKKWNQQVLLEKREIITKRKNKEIHTREKEKNEQEKTQQKEIKQEWTENNEKEEDEWWTENKSTKEDKTRG